MLIDTEFCAHEGEKEVQEKSYFRNEALAHNHDPEALAVGTSSEVPFVCGCGAGDEYVSPLAAICSLDGNILLQYQLLVQTVCALVQIDGAPLSWPPRSVINSILEDEQTILHGSVYF